jgi:ribosomal-protein-alanine N-acetyltransferase
MTYDRCTAADISKIARLEKESFSDPWSEKSIADLVASDSVVSFVAKDGDELFGYIIVRIIAPEGELYRIAVDKSMRQRGIGYKLIKNTVDHLLPLGLETLFLEVRSQNEAAISLYKSYGFTQIGLRRNYYKDPTDDAIIMLWQNRTDLV